MFRIFCIAFFLISQLCVSEELTREQLIAGVNQSRNLIQSGEMRLIFTQHYANPKSPEEIQTWMEKEKEKIRSQYSASDQSELQQIYLKALPFRATMNRRSVHRESNVAFNIQYQDSGGDSGNFQYKMTAIDRRGLDPSSDEARYTEGDYFRVLTYDGQTQVFEGLNRFPAQSISFYKNSKYEGFQDFELFGRSLNRVPYDAKLIGHQVIGNADCYLLEFRTKNAEAPTDVVRVWVDPQKQFCIRKEERRQEEIRPPVTWELVYEDFQKYGEIWFPSVTRWIKKQETEIDNVQTVLVKEARFNIDFPAHFFEINPQSYLNQGLRVELGSEISAESLGKRSYEPPLPDKSQLEQDLLLSCGPNSLLRICELLKVDASFEELARLSNFDPNVGTTMLGLLQAAKYKGLNPKGIKANVKALKKIPMPAIAYLKGNHFLVFEKAVSDGVLISDPAKKYDHYLSSKELSQIWGGEILIFDYKPERAPSEPVPRVLADSMLYDFGEAHGGSQVKHTFKLKNVGTHILKILKVEHSCSCTATIVSKNEILPGEYGMIEAVLKVPSENREVEESVDVYTNDPMQNKVKLILKGTAFVPITTFPTRVFFGQVPSKGTPKKTLTVHRGVGKDVHITGVRVNSTDLRANIVSEKQSEIIRVEVALLESMPIGPFNWKLLIDYNYEGKKATHTVEVIGEVLGEFAVSPRNFFFGLVEGEKAVSKKVTISPINSQPFKITGVQSNSKYVMAKVAPQADGMSYHLTATINPTAPPGQLSGEILVKTNSAIQPTIRVPFFSVIPGKN